MKSDGSTLYISRDVAAFVDRVRTFGFDKMLYVVENGQADHFQNLFALVKEIGNGRSERKSGGEELYVILLLHTGNLSGLLMSNSVAFRE